MEEKKKGLNVISAAILIAGEMAGSGVLSLPKAVADIGWFGIIMLIIFCINSSYGGTRLAECWIIIEERHPEYRGSTRNPYAVIAEEAMGCFGRYLASASVQITLFGVGTVTMLQASQIVQELLKTICPNLTYCIWLLIVAALITPPMWLGSPKDFWIAGVGALISTFTSCILVFIQIIYDGIDKQGIVVEHKHELIDFLTSFGVILYSFGGASTFPTIQNDMNERHKFVKSVCLGFLVLLLMYIPLTVAGFLVYGDEINGNILLSLKKSWFVIVANIMLACHLLTAFLILVNPVCQEIENALNVPKKFTIKRIIVRFGLVVCMVFTAESIPEFGKILSLIGASTVTLLTFVLPNLLYMLLCNQEHPEFKKRHIPWYMKLYMWILILIGLFGGIASTYTALVSIFSSQTFTKPCYWP